MADGSVAANYSTLPDSMGVPVLTIKIAADGLQEINAILRQHIPPHYKIFAFGSRVKGSPQRYSDLDLLIAGPQALDRNILFALSDTLEHSDITITVDIVDKHRISDNFYQHIF